MFKCILIEKDAAGYRSSLTELDEGQLPDGDVTVRVSYSSLNYKDALAITGKGPVVRRFPMVPGVDLAGTVEHSSHPDYQAGDAVILNGWGVGESHWGGLAQKARLNGDWLVPLPEGMSERDAMAIGTAGFTAMLCVLALEDGGVRPDSGPVLVTGASGGVGSVAVALLGKLGYEVTAATGRTAESDYLRDLGASEIRSREEMSAKCRPLEKQRWAGVVDTVGGDVLVRALAETRYNGTVAACGLAGSHELKGTVMPFILRNVRLQGVDSVVCPPPRREQAWQRLQQDLELSRLGEVAQEISLEQVPEYAERILRGEVRGRTLIRLG